MIRFLNKRQPLALCLLRITLGASMLVHGWGKVVPPGGFSNGHSYAALEHHAAYVAALGLPRWLGFVSALTEFLGGALLVVGLLSRFAAFMVAGNMLVALILVNLRHGYSASEYTLSLLSMAVLLVVAGSGALSLDRKLGWS